MATLSQLKTAINALPEPQKSIALAIYNQAESTGTGVSDNEITYIMNNLSYVTGSTDPKVFLGTADQRVDANKNGGVVPGFATATAAAAPAADATDWSAQYGVQAALVNSDSGLKALFDQAVTEKWTPEKFQAAFVNSTWYTTHSDTWRAAETTRTADPASWTEQLNAASNLIRQTATSMGFELDETQVANLASQSLYLAGGSAGNIDPKILKTHVAETGKITGSGGTALSTIDALKQYAYQNGIQYNDNWYTTAATDVLTGDGTIEGWNKQIKDAAISKYAALAPQLNAGMTVMDVASPYIQQMATTFELDPNNINLDDPLMQKALTNIDQGNQPALKPLWQFQRELKQDDRYFKTNAAVQDMTGLASEIARQFGKM